MRKVSKLEKGKWYLAYICSGIETYTITFNTLGEWQKMFDGRREIHALFEIPSPMNMPLDRDISFMKIDDLELVEKSDAPTGEYQVAYIAESPKSSTTDLKLIIERLQVCFNRFEDETYRNDIPFLIDDLRMINGLPDASLSPRKKTPDFTPIPNNMDVSLLGQNLKENDLSLDGAIEMTADQQGLTDHYEAQDLKEQAHFDKLDMHNDRKMDSGVNVNTDFFDARNLK